MKKILLYGAIAAMAIASFAPGAQATEFATRLNQLGQNQQLEGPRHRRPPRRHRGGWGWGGGFYYGPRPVYRPRPGYYYGPGYYNPGYYYNPGVVVVPGPPAYYCP